MIPAHAGRALGAKVPLEEARAALPTGLPDIALSHGRAVWVLTELGFRGTVGAETFREYIKSLRKLGIPFAHGEVGLSRRGLAVYSYFHLMELALTLTLRVYHVVPDAVLHEIVRFRQSLYGDYRRAYGQRDSGRGSAIVARTSVGDVVAMRGLFLDLQISFAGGRLASFGPPKLLSPGEALRAFAQRESSARAFVPINLSLLAERVVAFALMAPMIRRGPGRAVISNADLPH